MGTTEVSTQPLTAETLATMMLDGVGTRFAHTSRVAHQATIARQILDDPWRDVLVDAAWLHDIGYNAELSATGFHPLDGARWLRDQGWSVEICRLVAWHTGAGTEAGLRGLNAVLTGDFEAPPAHAQAALAWADLTSSPTGERCTASERLQEILDRYPPDSVVHQATTANLEGLLDVAREVEIDIEAAQGRP